MAPHNWRKGRQRGTPDQRGYGTAHRALRARWAPLVARGGVRCWRCGKPIPAGSRWHLGHDDRDRSIYRGPEHASCNLRAAAQAGRRKSEEVKARKAGKLPPPKAKPVPRVISLRYTQDDWS
jgi:hypothetical protein